MSLADVTKATKGKVKTTGVSDFMELQIDIVYPNPYQPRKFFDETKLQELAQSIEEHGLLQPIVVTKDANGKYMIIAGERRYKAHLINSLRTIKAFISDVDIDVVKEQSLVENIQRDDLTDFEIANYITGLWNDGKYKQKQDLAKKLGKTKSYISKALGLVKLDDEIKEDLSTSKTNIGLSVLEEVSRVKDPVVQKEVYKKVKNKEITRSEIKDFKEPKKEDNKNKNFKQTVLTQDGNIEIEEDDNFTGEIKEEKKDHLSSLALTNDNGRTWVICNNGDFEGTLEIEKGKELIKSCPNYCYEVILKEISKEERNTIVSLREEITKLKEENTEFKEADGNVIKAYEDQIKQLKQNQTKTPDQYYPTEDIVPTLKVAIEAGATLDKNNYIVGGGEFKGSHLDNEYEVSIFNLLLEIKELQQTAPTSFGFGTQNDMGTYVALIDGDFKGTLEIEEGGEFIETTNNKEYKVTVEKI